MIVEDLPQLIDDQRWLTELFREDEIDQANNLALIEPSNFPVLLRTTRRIPRHP